MKDFPKMMSRCEANEDGQHRYEASTKVYLDIDKFHLINGTVIIDDMSASHLNDELHGERMDLEANVAVSCADCGEEFDFDFSDEFRQYVGWQPIGNAERTLGKRGGTQ